MKTSTAPQPFESAKAVLDRLHQIHYPALYDPNDKWYSFKCISIVAAVSEVVLDGDFAEFGVFRGKMAKFMEPLVRGDRKLHLLDSFEGLPEDWIGPWKKGMFSLAKGQMPSFESERVVIHKGWFSETAPALAKSLDKPLAFIHADADLYSSTIDLLFALDRHIVPGTIILFDEYMMVHEGQSDDGEHRALVEWADKFDRKFEYLWRTRWMQVAIRVLT